MVVLLFTSADDTVIVLLYVTVICFCLQWQLKQAGSGFSIIDSKYISLYTSECVCCFGLWFQKCQGSVWTLGIDLPIHTHPKIELMMGLPPLQKVCVCQQPLC